MVDRIRKILIPPTVVVDGVEMSRFKRRLRRIVDKKQLSAKKHEKRAFKELRKKCIECAKKGERKLVISSTEIVDRIEIGKDIETLKRFCEKYGFSYLGVRKKEIVYYNIHFYTWK